MSVKASIPSENSLELAVKQTKIRWRVFLVLLLLVTINYVDRSVLSIAMPSIQKDLNLNPALEGIILSAFFWGYAPMQLPTGWMADRIRPDKLIFGSALLWGIVQTLTGVVTGSKMLVFLRILLGVAESPVYPAGTKLQSVWLSQYERARGATLLDSGNSLGTAFGGPIVIFFMMWFGGWRGALIGAGLLTIFIGWFSWRIIKGGPDQNSKVNDAERQYIKKALAEEFKKEREVSSTLISKKDYLKSKNFWSMLIGFYSLNTIFYGLMTWGPTYLAKTHNLDIKSIGSSILIIFMFGFFGNLTGGWIADTWRAKGGKYNTVMHTLLVVSGILTAISILSLNYVTSLPAAIALLAAALFFLRWSALYWSIPAAISQRAHIGMVAGSMNFLGNVAGIVTPIYVGLIVSVTGSYFLALIIFSLFGLLLAGASSMINFNKKIGADDVVSG